MPSGSTVTERARDKPLDRAERPCSACGKMFAPTTRRRLLCAYCFGKAGDVSPFEP